MPAGRGLTPKQKMFVAEYLVDLNASAALKRAGYKSNNPDVDGYKLLVSPSIQAEIQGAMKAREKRTLVTQDMVVAELAKMGFSNIGKYAKWSGESVSLEPSEALGEDELACVAEVSQTATQNGNSVKFKLHDKKGALELLGRHLGMFTENLNVTGELAVKIIDDIEK